MGVGLSLRSGQLASRSREASLIQKHPNQIRVSFVLDRLGRGDPGQPAVWAEHPILGNGLAAKGGLCLAQQIPKLPSHNRVRRCHQVSFTCVWHHDPDDYPAQKPDEGDDRNQFERRVDPRPPVPGQAHSASFEPTPPLDPSRLPARQHRAPGPTCEFGARRLSYGRPGRRSLPLRQGTRPKRSRS